MRAQMTKRDLLYLALFFRQGRFQDKTTAFASLSRKNHTASIILMMVNCDYFVSRLMFVCVTSPVVLCMYKFVFSILFLV